MILKEVTETDMSKANLHLIISKLLAERVGFDPAKKT